MVDTILVGNALQTFSNTEDATTTVGKWRKARNEFLRGQGIGGIMKGEKKSKTIPDWWGEDAKFWFVEESSEVVFILKWSK